MENKEIAEYCIRGQGSFMKEAVFNMSNMDVGREKNQALEKYDYLLNFTCKSKYTLKDHFGKKFEDRSHFVTS